MSEKQARDFYATTNSVPHAGALWLQGEEMARWIAPADRSPANRVLDAPLESALRLALARSGGALLEVFGAPMALRAEPAPAAPRLAYRDLGASLGTGLLDSVPAFP